MNQKNKHYRCTHCRKLVTFSVANKNQKLQPTCCTKCHAALDEHDEVVRMVRTKYHPNIQTC